MERVAPGVFARLMGVPLDEVRVTTDRSRSLTVLDAVGHRFLLQEKPSADAMAIAAAARHVRSAVSGQSKTHVPLICVPYMGEVGKKVCQTEGVGWFDLSGNSHITAPGLRILSEGKPNLFLRRGRPRDLFSPRRLRVVRWLLSNQRPFTQRELATHTGSGEGYVSQIIASLEEAGFVERGLQRSVHLANAALMLAAWREAADFSKHTIVRGHVPARSGPELQERIAKALMKAKVGYAMTGLGAAWCFTHFAMFRTATVFVDQPLQQGFLDDLGWREDPRGANTWLVSPNDPGVFDGVATVDGLRCVAPVQAYIDLKDQPERSGEAAERLRSDVLPWSTLAKKA